VFILPYDENDGNFDHMPPPAAPPGTLNEWISAAQASAAGFSPAGRRPMSRHRHRCPCRCPQVRNWPPVNQDCFLVLDRSSFGQMEVQAMLTANFGPAVFQSALFLVIDGFSLSGLGFQTVNQAIAWAPTIVLDPPQPSITFVATVIASGNAAFPSTPRHFTPTYAAQFTDASATN
jgi:phospholipase C